MPMLLLFALLAYLCAAAPPPQPIYDSYGPNQLFYQEGQSIRTINGKKAMYGVSPDRCARDCNFIERKCNCCNSFAYQPWSGKCYLKKRSESASNAHSYNSHGWQSYKYYGLSHPAYGYTGDLPDTAYGYSVGYYIGWPFTKSFVGKGPNKVARYEGYTVTQASGVSVRQCAEMCLGRTCDGFSYNPYQEGGKCYLKNNSALGKYSTVYSSDGWTFYWLEDNLDRCFCPCASDFVCAICGDDGVCDDD